MRDNAKTNRTDAVPTQPSRPLAFPGGPGETDVVIDIDNSLLRRNRQLVSLPTDYWKGLRLLIVRRPNTVPRDQLCSAMRCTDATLYKQINVIRDALDPPNRSRFIQIDRKVGYRFVAEPAEGTVQAGEFVGVKLPAPEQVRWQSGHGGVQPGMVVESRYGTRFIPWPELKVELEQKLIRYLGRHLPKSYTQYSATMGSGYGGEHWHIFIVDADTGPIGHVWIGGDPASEMRWDGLIRVGEGEVRDGTAQVWQVFQRWSDGSYRRFAALGTPPRTAEPVSENEASPKPLAQRVRWGPVDGKPAGICIGSCRDGPFVPWDNLKREVEKMLLPQVRRVPIGSTVRLRNLGDRADWIVRIVDPSGSEIGDVWFGTDADGKWHFDGLVRLGESYRTSENQQVVWEVFERYSDGSYRRVVRRF